jgi:hypothetical protein
MVDAYVIMTIVLLVILAWILYYLQDGNNDIA